MAEKQHFCLFLSNFKHSYEKGVFLRQPYGTKRSLPTITWVLYDDLEVQEYPFDAKTSFWPIPATPGHFRLMYGSTEWEGKIQWPTFYSKEYHLSLLFLYNLFFLTKALWCDTAEWTQVSYFLLRTVHSPHVFILVWESHFSGTSDFKLLLKAYYNSPLINYR